MHVVRQLSLSSVLVLLSGCLLLPPDQVFPSDDDDTTTGDDDDTTTGDDDDTTGDDDDTTGDDDDSVPELPPCAFDGNLPGVHDNDGDGWPGQSVGLEECDCDDNASLVYPGALEVFDLTTNDCDAQGDGPEVLEAPGTLDSQPAVLFDHYGTGEELGTHYSVGDLDNNGAADLCVRGRTEAWVLMDYAESFLLSGELGRSDLINITGLEPNGSIDCSANINGERGTDLLINHFPDDVGGDGGASLVGGGELLMYDGDEVASSLLLFPSDANLTWPQTTVQIGWKALCMGTGDFLAATGVEIVTAALPLGDGDDDVTFHILGYQSVAQQEIFISRQTVDTSSLDDPMEVRCWGLGDVSDGGRDDVLLDGGTATELWFGEQLGLGGADSAMLTFDDLQATAATSGDFTGDGIDDLALGVTTWFSTDGPSAAAAMIRGGLSNGEWSEAEGLDGGVNPAYGVNITDVRYGADLGFAACSLGDLDGDGADEVLFTAPGDEDMVGEARLYGGRSWTEWSQGGSGDLNEYERGSETTRFLGSTLDGGMGTAGACDTAWSGSDPATPWAMVSEPWAWPMSEDEGSRLWVWESFPSDQ